VLAKVVAANAAPLELDGALIRPTVSVGAASYPEDATVAELLRKHADAAVYEAKAGGGNRCVFYRR
jgi:GGDEF domain-containing protein